MKSLEISRRFFIVKRTFLAFQSFLDSNKFLRAPTHTIFSSRVDFFFSEREKMSLFL